MFNLSDTIQTNNGLSQRQLTDGIKLLELQRHSQIQVSVVFNVCVHVFIWNEKFIKFHLPWAS